MEGEGRGGDGRGGEGRGGEREGKGREGRGALTKFRKSTINTNNLHMCNFGRMEMQHVNLQSALRRKFLQTHGTDISFEPVWAAI